MRMERWEAGQAEGGVQVSLADHRGNRYREQNEERHRVVFVWLLCPTTRLLSEKSGVVGGVSSPL